jgi:hypothetical protein
MTYAALDDGRHVPQGIVAFGVAQGIVYFLKVVHIDHDDGIRFLHALGSQLAYEFVKGITVPDARKAVDLGIGTDNEEIGVQQGCGKTGPYQRGVSGNNVGQRSRAVKNQKNQG